MKTNYLWTKLGARLQFVKSNLGEKYNWIFLPGGAGFGSEYLSTLIKNLHLPGTIWLVDLPGDGSNIAVNDENGLSNWETALIEAVSSLEKVILVAHSAGGMFALATAKLENLLSGLVLISTAPDSSWLPAFLEYVAKHPSEELEKWQKKYTSKPSNEYFREFVRAILPYWSATKGLPKLIPLLDKIAFNYQAYEWYNKNFQPSYKLKWYPREIPTLILAGDEDHITPLILFSKSKNFKRKNILIHEIKKSGHFPWMDNPKQVILVFEEYCRLLNNDLQSV